MRTPKLLLALSALALLLPTPGCAIVNLLVEYPTPTPTLRVALRPTFTPTVALPVSPTPTAPPLAILQATLPAATDTPAAPVEAQVLAQQPLTVTVELLTPTSESATATAEAPTATTEPPTATAEPATATPQLPTPTVTPTPKPEVVVNNPRVNVRTGPGLSFTVLGQALQGDRLDIIGRDEQSEWWQVCCYQGQTGWMADQVVAAQGPLEQIALAAELITPTAQATATPEPVATDTAQAPVEPTPTAQATVAPVATGDYPFSLTEQTDYPFSADYLRIGVKANDAGDAAMMGLYLRVVNETTGQQWLSPATGSTPWRGTAVSPALADYRQANLIYDTRGRSALSGNTFAFWLVNNAGRQVSPTVHYTQNGDEVRWLYVVWTRR